jgi:hypothetical protein
VYMLHELETLASPWRRCVRVAGFVEWLDVQQKQCVIAHRGHHLRVDCTLADLSKLKPDSLCQLIGEIRQYSQEVWMLRRAAPVLLRWLAMIDVCSHYTSTEWECPRYVFTCVDRKKC